LHPFVKAVKPHRLIGVNSPARPLRYKFLCSVTEQEETFVKNWPQMTKELTAQLRNLRGGAPEVMKAFAGMAQAATAPKALDGKTKELIALAISVAVRCDDCIAFHVKAALREGASQDEVLETLGMAIYMGAGPAVMYASHALDAFGQFEREKAGQTVSAA
jgi:AhpD family alkylhydroperoxidase